MSQSWAKDFYASKAWQRTRYNFLSSKFFLCNRCSKPAIIVHHIVKLTSKNIHDASITLNWDNLESLCLECHNNIHMSGSKSCEGTKFDNYGNLVKL